MEDLRALIEAALFVSGRSLSLPEIAKICQHGNIGGIRKIIESLKEKYSSSESGIEIYEIGGRYGMRVKQNLESRVMKLVPETEIPPAMLKTLALIAYKQPITQAELVKERGNRAYYYIRKLREKELVEGKKHGRTRMLTVTPKFREYFQIQDLKELVKR